MIVYVCVCSLWLCGLFLHNESIIEAVERAHLNNRGQKKPKKPKSIRKHDFVSSHITCIDQYFPWKRCNTVCVCVCVEGRGCIMGHPTDIICLPICTLLAKPSLRNSFTEQCYGSDSVSIFKQFIIWEKVSYRPLSSDVCP